MSENEPTRFVPLSDMACGTLLALLQKEAAEAELRYQRSDRDESAARRANQLAHAANAMQWLSPGLRARIEGALDRCASCCLDDAEDRERVTAALLEALS